MRYIAALLAVALLLSAAVLALFAEVTTESFARVTLGSEGLLMQQQAEIDTAADALADQWQVSPAVLDAWADGAARRHNEALAAWWGALWSDPAADAALPAWLDASQEWTLVAEIMADESFIAATDMTQRRAIARDEVAYALDEAVCNAVTPLRRSVVDMALALVQEAVSLPMLRRVALLGAAVLAGLALVLLLFAHRAAGSGLVAAGVLMALSAVPVVLMDVPGMLRQLSPIAAEQGLRVLLGMGVLWGVAALALVCVGLLIIGVKRALRGRRV